MDVEISDGNTAIRSVLIVEDEALLALVIEDIVRDLGADSVQIFCEAAPALDAAANSDFDCAILDVVLPDGESTPVADILAQRGIPFLFSTGSGRDSVPERHRHRPIITKPFPDGDLQALLLEAMTSRDGAPRQAAE
ncbi:MAG TPA: response regulator [Devosia sp.]|nr:response regulator [Devosia sp.]